MEEEGEIDTVQLLWFAPCIQNELHMAQRELLGEPEEFLPSRNTTRSDFVKPIRDRFLVRPLSPLSVTNPVLRMVIC